MHSQWLESVLFIWKRLKWQLLNILAWKQLHYGFYTANNGIEKCFSMVFEHTAISISSEMSEGNISTLCLCKLVRKTNGRHLFVMDNDSSQTRKSAKTTLQDIEAEFHEIPPR